MSMSMIWNIGSIIGMVSSIIWICVTWWRNRPMKTGEGFPWRLYFASILAILLLIVALRDAIALVLG